MGACESGVTNPDDRADNGASGGNDEADEMVNGDEMLLTEVTMRASQFDPNKFIIEEVDDAISLQDEEEGELSDSEEEEKTDE